MKKHPAKFAYGLLPSGRSLAPLHLVAKLRARLRKVHPKLTIVEHIEPDAYVVEWSSLMHRGAVRFSVHVTSIDKEGVLRHDAGCHLSHKRTASSVLKCPHCLADRTWIQLGDASKVAGAT